MTLGKHFLNAEYGALTRLYCYYKTLLRRSVHCSVLCSATIEIFLRGSDRHSPRQDELSHPGAFTIHHLQFIP